MTNSNSQAEQTVKTAINDLIQAGTSFDVDALERIYHDDMAVIMIDTESNLNQFNKTDFKNLFASKKAEGAAPLNTLANFNSIAVDGDKSHVVVTRNVNLTGEDQILVLSIDLVFEDDRWQVTREVIFARADA